MYNRFKARKLEKKLPLTGGIDPNDRIFDQSLLKSESKEIKSTQKITQFVKKYGIQSAFTVMLGFGLGFGAADTSGVFNSPSNASPQTITRSVDGASAVSQSVKPEKSKEVTKIVNQQDSQLVKALSESENGTEAMKSWLIGSGVHPDAAEKTVSELSSFTDQFKSIKVNAIQNSQKALLKGIFERGLDNNAKHYNKSLEELNADTAMKQFDNAFKPINSQNIAQKPKTGRNLLASVKGDDKTQPTTPVFNSLSFTSNSQNTPINNGNSDKFPIAGVDTSDSQEKNVATTGQYITPEISKPEAVENNNKENIKNTTKKAEIQTQEAASNTNSWLAGLAGVIGVGALGFGVNRYNKSKDSSKASFVSTLKDEINEIKSIKGASKSTKLGLLGKRLWTRARNLTQKGNAPTTDDSGFVQPDVTVFKEIYLMPVHSDSETSDFLNAPEIENVFPVDDGEDDILEPIDVDWLSPELLPTGSSSQIDGEVAPNSIEDLPLDPVNMYSNVDGVYTVTDEGFDSVFSESIVDKEIADVITQNFAEVDGKLIKSDILDQLMNISRWLDKLLDQNHYNVSDLVEYFNYLIEDDSFNTKYTHLSFQSLPIIENVDDLKSYYTNALNSVVYTGFDLANNDNVKRINSAKLLLTIIDTLYNHINN